MTEETKEREFIQELIKKHGVELPEADWLRMTFIFTILNDSAKIHEYVGKIEKSNDEKAITALDELIEYCKKLASEQ